LDISSQKSTNGLSRFVIFKSVWNEHLKKGENDKEKKESKSSNNLNIIIPKKEEYLEDNFDNRSINTANEYSNTNIIIPNDSGQSKHRIKKENKIKLLKQKRKNESSN
jgi:hypothetical protein